MLQSKSVFFCTILIYLVSCILSTSRDKEPHHQKRPSKADIFLIGVQQGATSSLHNVLRQHPEICSKGVKEKHFFDVDENWNKGLKFYASMFDCKQNEMSIDSTPYFGFTSVPWRIQKAYSSTLLKNKKFILVLREPVSREFSFYRHRLAICADLVKDPKRVQTVMEFARRSCEVVMPGMNGTIPTSYAPISFKNYVLRGNVGDNGYYHNHLKNWLKIIGREQLFIVNMEAMVRHPNAVMEKIRQFLGLKVKFEANLVFPHDVDSHHMAATLDCETYDMLKNKFDYKNSGLLEMIRQSTNKPIMEPHFDDFEDRRPECNDLDVVAKPFNDTANPPVAPNVFLIGVRGAATSSLHRLIMRNQDFCQDGVKEKHFFDDEKWKNGYSFYQELFDVCKPKTLTMDATPMLHNSVALTRIRRTYGPEHLGSKKFILILRHPVDREYSVYQHRVSLCSSFFTEKSKVKEEVEMGRQSCGLVMQNFNSDKKSFDPMTFREYYMAGHLVLRDGFYEEHLMTWLKVVPREQLFILNMQTLIDDADGVMQSLEAFLDTKHSWRSELGVDKVVLPNDQDLASKVPSLDCQTSEELSAIFDSRNEHLISLINNALHKPPTEPPFPPFTMTKKCVDSGAVKVQMTKLGFKSPDIFILGVQKGGTTSLNGLMRTNPEICNVGEKEKHFFDSGDLWQKGLAAYGEMFADCPPNTYSIDATPYFSVRGMPERFQRTYALNSRYLRAKKFIIVLREPVSREFSYYEHRVRVCSDLIYKPERIKHILNFARLSCKIIMPSFVEGTTKDFTPISFRQYYLNGGLQIQDSAYESHLRNWLEVVERDQMFILSMQTLLTNTSDTMARLVKFLGLEIGFENTTFPHENESAHVGAILDCATYDEIAKYYDNSGFLQLVRESPNKPSHEPYFPDFDDTRKRCVPLLPLPSPTKWVDNKDRKCHERAASHSSPNIFLIGAHRSATTSLDYLLRSHVQICDIGPKEKHFFDQDVECRAGLKLYGEQFSLCDSDELTIDSTNVFHLPFVPARIQQIYPNNSLAEKKFILVLREPIAREFAFFEERLRLCSTWMKQSADVMDVDLAELSCAAILRNGKEDVDNKHFDPMTFHEYYTRGHIDVRASSYASDLANWLKVISRSQLFIINMQSLVADTAGVMQRLKDFLRLETGWGKAVTLPNENEAAHLGAVLDCDTHRDLQRVFEESNQRLYDMINADPLRPPMEPTFPHFWSKCQYKVSTTAIGDHVTIDVPEVFVIGVQCPGLTYLQDLMVKHPHICGKGRREKAFFNQDEEWEQGLAYYADMFSTCPTDTLRVDFTSMFRYSSVPPRIRLAYTLENLRKKKFILVLREPMESEFGWYQHTLRECGKALEGIAAGAGAGANSGSGSGSGSGMRRGKSPQVCSEVTHSLNVSTGTMVPLTFEQYLQKQSLQPANGIGMYEGHLSNWLQVVDRGQIFIVNVQTLLTNMTDTMKRIKSFLGLEKGWEGLADGSDANLARASIVDRRNFENLTSLPYGQNSKLLELIRSSDRPIDEPDFPAFERQTARWRRQRRG